MKSIFIAPAIAVLIFSCTNKSRETLKIATSANMQLAINELVTSFEQQTGIESEVILGSSGKLSAQIEAGAPFNIFLSADTLYTSKIYRQGLSDSPPFIYAYGKLVLWSNLKSKDITYSLLLNEEVKHIALANPKTAPYGKAAIEVLRYYKMDDDVKHKLVFGENISQTNQFIISQSAQIGFTSLSSVVHKSNIGTWLEVDSIAYTPIAQSLIIIEKHKNDDAAKFYDFIISKKGQSILKKFGYSIPK